jgi:hypothetical protein
VASDGAECTFVWILGKGENGGIGNLFWRFLREIVGFYAMGRLLSDQLGKICIFS